MTWKDENGGYVEGAPQSKYVESNLTLETMWQLSAGISIVDSVFEHVTMSQSSHLLTGKDVLAGSVRY